LLSFFSFINNDGRINPQSKLDFQNWALATRLPDRKMPIEKMWEPRFVEYANKVLKSGQ
jgi:hypothetical protein